MESEFAHAVGLNEPVHRFHGVQFERREPSGEPADDMAVGVEHPGVPEAREGGKKDWR